MPLLAESLALAHRESTGRVERPEMTDLCVYVYLDEQVESAVKSPAQDCDTESRALVRLVHLSFKEACTSYESKAAVMYILYPRQQQG